MSARVVVGNLGEHIKAAVLAELREYPRNVQLRESRALVIRARVAGGGGYSETGPVQGGPGGAVGDRYLEALERDPYWRWLDLKVQVVDQAPATRATGAWTSIRCCPMGAWYAT